MAPINQIIKLISKLATKTAPLTKTELKFIKKIPPETLSAFKQPMIKKGVAPLYRTPGIPTTEALKFWREEMLEMGFPRKNINRGIGQALQRRVNPTASDDLYSLADYLDALDAELIEYLKQKRAK